MTNLDEIWKDIPEYEGYYQASTKGRIKSARYNKIMKHYVDEHGYQKIKLQRNGHLLNTSVGRLVAITFIPNPNNLPQVNHINGKPWINEVENLEWCTVQENIDHKMKYLFNRESYTIKMRDPKRCAKIGNSVRGAKNPFAKKVIDTATGEMFGCVGDAATKYGYTYNQLKQWLNGRRKNCSTLKYAA